MKHASGLTLVEISLASLVLMILLGLVFEFYQKSSSMAAKGVWRVGAENQVRKAHRVLQDCIGGASYPSQATQQVMTEFTDNAYKIRLNAPAAASATASSGGRTIYEFLEPAAAAYPVLSMWQMAPVLSTGATPPCTQWIFSYAPAQNAAAPDTGVMLLSRTEGTYSATVDATGHISAVNTTMLPAVVRTLVQDVQKIRVTASNDTGVTLANQAGLLTVEIVCRDNVDGKLIQTATVTLQKNIALVLMP